MAYYPFYPARMRDFRVSSLLEGCSQFIPGVPGSSSSIPNNLNSNGPFPYSPYHPPQIAKQPSHFGPGAIPGPPQQVHMPVHDSEHESIDVNLDNKDLWQSFYEEKTEMVITKAGRYNALSCGQQKSGLRSLLEFRSEGLCRFKRLEVSMRCKYQFKQTILCAKKLNNPPEHIHSFRCNTIKAARNRCRFHRPCKFQAFVS